MKKLTLFTVLSFLGLGLAFSQAMRDRAVVPVAVNLNQVLRITIIEGGNIEFVFNSIDDYRYGLSGDAATSGSANPAASGPGSFPGGPLPGSTDRNFYDTEFIISSSTNWTLFYGSEEATFIGTDSAGNTLALNNVGFTLNSLGTYTIGATAADQLSSPPIANNSANVAALDPYPTVLLEHNTVGPGPANAGDAQENWFEMIWRCGTAEVSAVPNPMNAQTLLQQGNIAPDRYVTNVLFELEADLN